MTPKEVKAYLSRAWSIDREIEVLEKARQEMWDRCLSITAPIKEKVSSGNDGSDSLLIKYIDFAKKLEETIDKLIDVKTEVFETIQKLDSERHRSVLILRYINFYNWEKIAVTLGYSYMQTCRIHGEALKMLAEKM